MAHRTGNAGTYSPIDPSVSVVVPTRDRAEHLHALLDSLARQSLPGHRFEVLVIDDGSSQPGMAEFDGLRNGLLLRVLRHSRSRGPAAARNTGWRAARAPLVAFIDDDCRADPNWLEALLAATPRSDAAVVQGRTEPIDRSLVQPLSRTVEVLGKDLLFETCNILYPRVLLERLNGFDEWYRHACGEDVDLGWRAMGAGAEVVFCADALVRHDVHHSDLPSTLWYTARWSDAARVVKAHPGTRRLLVGRVFWKATHPKLLGALAAAMLGAQTRRPVLAVPAALPYLLHYRRVYGPARRPWLSTARRLPQHLVVDLFEVGTMLAGSVRHRTLML